MVFALSLHFKKWRDIECRLLSCHRRIVCIQYYFGCQLEFATLRDDFVIKIPSRRKSSSGTTMSITVQNSFEARNRTPPTFPAWTIRDPIKIGYWSNQNDKLYRPVYWCWQAFPITPFTRRSSRDRVRSALNFLILCPLKRYGILANEQFALRYVLSRLRRYFSSRPTSPSPRKPL